MTFAPKKKTSKSRSGNRESNWLKLAALKLKNSVMLNKAKTGLSHFITEDGTYKGEQLLKIKKKSKKVTRI